MYLIMLGWLYVVGMVALTTATHPRGSVLEAVLVFLFFGVLPMGLAYYILGHGARRRKRRLAESADADAEADADAGAAATASEHAAQTAQGALQDTEPPHQNRPPENRNQGG